MMKDIYIDTEFGQVFGKSAGQQDNPLVLGIHGWSQRNGWHTWEPMMRPLAQAGFRVVSVDMPGWGHSVSTQSEPLIGARAVTAVLAILNSFKADKATLMGKSWGGGVALSLSLSHPQRVTKLILTAPAFRQLDQLANLTQPVLLAWAEDDPVIPFKYAPKFTNAIPDCQLETYPAGGHSAAPKNAADFAPKAVEFLKRKT